MSIASEISALTADKTAIASAITAKGGTVASGDGFDDFASDIATIPTGSTPTLITKSITQNGTYNASDDSADGYSSVTVNVSGGSGGQIKHYTFTPATDVSYYNLSVTDVSKVKWASITGSIANQAYSFNKMVFVVDDSEKRPTTVYDGNRKAYNCAYLRERSAGSLQNGFDTSTITGTVTDAISYIDSDTNIINFTIGTAYFFRMGITYDIYLYEEA